MSESASYTSGVSEAGAHEEEIKNEALAQVSEPDGLPNLTADRDHSHEKLSGLQQTCEMPAVVPSQAPVAGISAFQSSQSRTEPVFKLERGESAELTDGSADCDKTCYENEATSVGREHPGFLGEEPLEIQCGENAALLYVSKLCQGSKGPCILFNNEWLTPNELQYISGRETAKDWKRSIRYKGKSLKSLIARGLIKVHPPICDCLGCRISSPVNRGRLASKCGLQPTSPRSRKRDTTKSLSCWNHEDLQPASAQRHFSTSDIECLARQAASNGLQYKERRESSSSSTSEGSEIHEDNPFSPVKRARSISPEGRTEERAAKVFKRRSSDSASVCFFPSHPGGDNLQYDPRALSMHRELSTRYLMSGERGMHSHEVQGDQKDKRSRCDEESGPRGEGPETRSAFRAVHQDGIMGMTIADISPEAFQREMVMRAAKLHKQKPPPSPVRGPSQFLPSLSHHITGASLVSPTHTSPRLPPDSLLLPHSNIYHPAFRGASYAGMQQLQQNLMQYRLLAPPPGVGNPPQSPLAGLSLQNKLLMHESAVAAMTTSTYTTGHASGKMSPHLENGVSSKKPRLSCDTSDNHRDHPVATTEESNGKRGEHLNGDKTNHVSVIHRSPAHSPVSIDGHPESRGSPAGKEPIGNRVSPHKLIPKLRIELDENILAWTVEDVCQFITCLTGAPEVANQFKDQSIDGQSLILLQEEHLLTRMGIRLGPALKIKAHIRKILEKLQASEQNHDNSDSS